jgi:hypothetical protein
MTWLATIALTVLSALPLARTVPHSRWLVRCSSVPVSAADGIEAEPMTTRPGVRQWALSKGLQSGVLVCYKLGTYNDAYVGACHGPTALRDKMLADAGCTHVIAWSQVASLPDAVKDWVKERSTCCGESSAGRAWQCSRDVTVTRLDGIGPAVVAGTDPCEAYPAPDEGP